MTRQGLPAATACYGFSDECTEGVTMVGRYGALGCAIILWVTPTAANEADALSGKLMWSAFTCGQYASLAGRDEEAGRLFELGYAVGQTFMEAVEAGTITEVENRTTVPAAVLPVLGGPTSEFILGRVYETALNAATEDVSVGSDPDQQRTIAEAKYAAAHCQGVR